jgi:hypothetical protein
MDTAESPCSIYTSQDHDVQGVLVSIGTATDDEGVEVEDDALSVWINQRQLFIQEARDVGMAILKSASDAEISVPSLKTALEAARR